MASFPAHRFPRACDAATATLRLSDRVARFTHLLRNQLKEGVNNPSRDLVDLLLKQVETPDEYRQTQAEQIGKCVEMTLTEYGNRLRESFNAGSAPEHLDLFLPGLDLSGVEPLFDFRFGSAENGVGRASHFGSIAFHKPGQQSGFGEFYTKISFGEFPGGDDGPPMHGNITAWIERVSRDEDPRYHLADLEEKTIEAMSRLGKASPQEVFQDMVSPLLRRKQSMFLGELDAQVPLVLIKSTQAGGVRLPNFVHVTPEASTETVTYLSKMGACEQCSTGDRCDVTSFEIPKGDLSDFWQTLLYQSDNFGGYFTACRDFAEFLLPFVFFDRPLLISCARSARDPGTGFDAIPGRGPVSLSFAIDPAPDALSVNEDPLAAWASVVAAGLHELVTEVDAAITAIDQQVQARRAELHRKRAVRHALRATVAGILGRSMAHDVGSHMLATAVLPSRAEAKVIAVNHKRGNAASDHDFFEHIKEYVRHRMTFIAEAATSEPYWQQPLSLKRVIEDFEKYGAADESRAPAAAMDYLAHSEGVYVQEVKTHGISDVARAAFPTGLVGCHALYCIFENIIRNAAKHTPRENGSTPLDLHVRLDSSRADGLLRLEVWDTLSDASDPEAIRRIAAYYPPKVLTDGPFLDHVVPSDSPSWWLVDEEGRPVQGGWGIKEMRIAAAWLRGQSKLEDLLTRDQDGEQPPLLKPRIFQENGREYLGVEFYLQRPKEVLVLSTSLAEKVQPDAAAKLIAEGVGLFKTAGEAIAAGWGSARFMVVDAEADGLATQLQESRLSLPLPLLIANDESRTLIDSIPSSAGMEQPEWDGFYAAVLEPRGLRFQLFPPLSKWIETNFSEWPKGASRILVGLARPSESLDKDQFAPWNGIRDSIETIHPLNEIPESQMNGRLLAFDNHHALWSKWNTHWDFREDYDSLSVTKHLLWNPPESSFHFAGFLVDLLAAALSAVIVVDERLAKESKLNNANLLRIRLVKEPEINFSNPKPWLDTLIDGTALDPKLRNLLIVHQGILDKAFSNRDEAEVWVRRLDESGKFSGITVVSDRGGLLEKQPHNVRQLPYSIVESALLHARWPSKLLLIQALLGARGGSWSVEA